MNVILSAMSKDFLLPPPLQFSHLKPGLFAIMIIDHFEKSLMTQIIIVGFESENRFSSNHTTLCHIFQAMPVSQHSFLLLLPDRHPDRYYAYKGKLSDYLHEQFFQRSTVWPLYRIRVPVFRITYFLAPIIKRAGGQPCNIHLYQVNSPAFQRMVFQIGSPTGLIIEWCMQFYQRLVIVFPQCFGHPVVPEPFFHFIAAVISISHICSIKCIGDIQYLTVFLDNFNRIGICQIEPVGYYTWICYLYWLQTCRNPSHIRYIIHELKQHP